MRGRSIPTCTALLTGALLAGPAFAQESPVAPAPAPSTAVTERDARLTQAIESAPPPPSTTYYFQYGVAFATEQVLSPGPICDAAGVPCVLGGGGGIVVRGGWRSKGPLYLGVAYELTKQDPNKLYRIALLQQARVEGRHYFPTARVTEPYLSASLGVSGYGNEWAIDTWGPGGSVGAGVEYQITHRTVVGVAVAYRLLYFSRFTDTAGTSRDPGIAQLIGLDLVLEQRDALVSTTSEPRR